MAQKQGDYVEQTYISKPSRYEMRCARNGSGSPEGAFAIFCIKKRGNKRLRTFSGQCEMAP